MGGLAGFAGFATILGGSKPGWVARRGKSGTVPPASSTYQNVTAATRIKMSPPGAGASPRFSSVVAEQRWLWSLPHTRRAR